MILVISPTRAMIIGGTLESCDVLPAGLQVIANKTSIRWRFEGYYSGNERMNTAMRHTLKEPGRLYTTAEVAARLDLTVARVNQLVASGDLQPTARAPHSKGRLFSEQAIEAYKKLLLQREERRHIQRVQEIRST
jgi:hypothetical protein